MSAIETETAIRIALTLAGHPEDQHANIVEAVERALGADAPPYIFKDNLPLAERYLRELEGDQGIPLNMRGAGSQG